MGVLAGISTRTPIRSIRITFRIVAPPCDSRAVAIGTVLGLVIGVCRLALEVVPERRAHQCGPQPGTQLIELAELVEGFRSRLGIALPQPRRDELLEKRRL